MADEQESCFIWNDSVTITGLDPLDTEVLVEGSPRAGGVYRIEELAKQPVSALNEKDKAKLTTMLLDMRQQGEQRPRVTCELIERAKRATPLPAYVRAERLLRYLVAVPEHVGEPFHLLDPPPRNLEVLAWSESTSWDEIDYLANYLTTMGWLEKLRNQPFYQITVSGYERVAEQSINKDLSQCFIAMWIDDSLNSVLEEGIEKAVKACGYTPKRIDKKHHFNKICDEAIAEIRRSRFVVADFTHGDDGARGSVFYEAGFAHALGLPVIFSCRKDQELHFDTRQYTHILWEAEEDLYTQLREKIGALIGDYNAEPTHAAL